MPMGKPHTADMSQTTSEKFGDRIAELLPLAKIRAHELAEATGVAYTKFSKWKDEDPEEKPFIKVEEAWAIAHVLADKTGFDHRVILLYLIDDDQPDGAPRTAMLEAWKVKLDSPIVVEPTPEPGSGPEPDKSQHIRQKTTKGPRPSRGRSRAQAKRKHLPG